MSKIGISESRDYFVRDGKPFFYLADTVWSAFTNISMPEWEEYLELRHHQNYNVLQINILPQWDRSDPDAIRVHPFELNDDGTYRFDRISEEYFRKAESMLERAAVKGFTPALVLLWSNYVQGTFFDNLWGRQTIPFCEVERYVSYAVEAFSRFDPIYLVSGDTNFSGDLAGKYYLKALETVKRLAPDAITTLHLCGDGFDSPEVVRGQIPTDLISSNYLDFYMYQSGHFSKHMNRCSRCAEAFYLQDIKRPVVNGEPCYEGWENGSMRYGAEDVRKTTWLSLLSGAKAGITYGAQGIWQWHKAGAWFPPADWEIRNKLYSCRQPMDYRTALRLEGAWEKSFARYIFESFDLFGIQPRSVILDEMSEIRFAAEEDSSKVIMYVPCSMDVMINMDLDNYDCMLIDLSGKKFGKPEIISVNGKSLYKAHPFNSDALLIGTKK